MEQIQPAYATPEQAKKLKEKGFDLECNSFYNFHKPQINGLRGLVTPREHNSGIYQDHNGETEDDDLICSAPEQWQIVEWLRINHGIWISIQIGHDENKVWYNVYLEKIELTYEFEPINNDFDIGGDTPQEAYSAAFDHILNELI
jgi:hypothetical protein